MANFFLVDQSLCDEGGHHYDYVRCLAEAGMGVGYKLHIATNRRFGKNAPEALSTLNQLGSVHPTFRNTIYQAASDLAGLRQMKHRAAQSNPTSVWDQVQRTITGIQRASRRKRLIQQFSSDCRRFFQSTRFTPQDHIFFTTINELELMGLALYLAKNQQTINPQWHCQFHFNVFSGRPPEYGQQGATANAVRSSFLSALSRLAYHNLAFYTTSNELAAQYNLLGIGHFRSLPYPISKGFFQKSLISGGSASKPRQKLVIERNNLWGYHTEATPSSTFGAIAKKPIRIVCPGAIRREKGQRNYLQELTDRLFWDYLKTGRVQIVTQRPIRKTFAKEKLEIKLPEVIDSPNQPIVYLSHPLSELNYLNLIHSADVGLLFYNSETYYSRRAGILGEMLAAGKPVIVPAGCWLAEQISESMCQHVQQQFGSTDVRSLELADFRWESKNVPLSGGRLSFDNNRHPFRFECDVKPQDSQVAFCFDWHWPQEKGVYCRIELEQFNCQGTLLKTDCQVVGHRYEFDRVCSPGQTMAMFNLCQQTTRLWFTLKNAYSVSTASIENASLRLRQGDRSTNIPTSAVGMIVADQQHLAGAVAEMVEHFQHYRETAAAFANPWYSKHDPVRTIHFLKSNELPLVEEAA